MTEAEYELLTRPHRRALQRLLLELSWFIEEAASLNVFSITSRLKTLQSATAKERRLQLPISNQQDLAGIRVVVSAVAEVNVIAGFLSVAEHNKLFKIVLTEDIDREDGYRARHIVVEAGYSITHSQFDVKVEFQLMTILQQAFNFTSRAWVYNRTPALPEDWKSRFEGVAGELRRLDGAISELHEAVLASAARGDPAEPLTPFSYQRIVEEVFSEKVSLDDAVDSTSRLIDLQCTTNGRLRSFFADERVRSLRDRFAGLTSERNRSLAQFWLEMPLHGFWLLAGVRLKPIHQFIDSLEKADRPD